MVSARLKVMTITSIAKRIGVATAALQVAARRVIGSPSDRDPVISMAITSDDLFLVENHGLGLAYDLQIQPVTFDNITAKFPVIPVVSSFHSAITQPIVTLIDESPNVSSRIGPLSRERHNIRQILSRQWADNNRAVNGPPSEHACPIKVRYRNKENWHFIVTADLILRIGSGELSIRNIKTDADQFEYREN